MKSAALVIGLMFILALPPVTGITSGEQHSSSEPSILYQASKREADDAKRKKNGRKSRSAKAKENFKKINPCPSTGKKSGACPRYVIEYIVPLKKGGVDTPSNMHWIPTPAAKAKKIEQ
jgi:hypothetical protein